MKHQDKIHIGGFSALQHPALAHPLAWDQCLILDETQNIYREQINMRRAIEKHRAYCIPIANAFFGSTLTIECMTIGKTRGVFVVAICSMRSRSMLGNVSLQHQLFWRGQPPVRYHIDSDNQIQMLTMTCFQEHSAAFPDQ